MEINWFSWGKQHSFIPVNENSYVLTALGSYVWTETEVAISHALYLHISAGHAKIVKNDQTSVLQSLLSSLLCCDETMTILQGGVTEFDDNENDVNYILMFPYPETTN